MNDQPWPIRLLWRLERARGGFSLPARGGIGATLYYARPLLGTIGSVIMQTLVREPALRYRCQRVGKGVRLLGRGPYIMGSGSIEIGDDVEFPPDCSLIVGHGRQTDAYVRIGDHVRFATGVTICAFQSVVIGNNCRIGGLIYDTDIHPRDSDARRIDSYASGAIGESLPVVIEDDAWVGIGSIVLKGVTIGKGAIVGAGAVITQDVPAHAIAAGNPARIVGSLR